MFTNYKVFATKRLVSTRSLKLGLIWVNDTRLLIGNQSSQFVFLDVCSFVPFSFDDLACFAYFHDPSGVQAASVHGLLPSTGRIYRIFMAVGKTVQDVSTRLHELPSGIQNDETTGLREGQQPDCRVVKTGN